MDGTVHVSWSKTTSPVWFDDAAFNPSHDDFSVDTYASDLLRYVPLDALRSQLLEYAAEMRDRLVLLVNEDYDEFANLSRRLVSVDQAIQELEAPLSTARAEIDQVRHRLLGHSNALKEAMRRRQNASEHRNSLELSKSAGQSLANVKTLMQSSKVFNSDGKAVWRGQQLDELCKNLDRICGELGRLLYVVRVNEIDSSEADSIKATIEAKLEEALVVVLDEQEPSSLATLLHAFSTIGCTELAEQVVRRHLIAGAVQRAAAGAASTVPLGPLSPSKLLECIRDGLMRDIWTFLDAATTMCGSSLPFDFLGASVLPEVVKAVEARYPTVYSPGNPDEFHQTLSTLEAFIRDLESLCTSQDQLIRFRNSAAWKTNRSKWNVAAYFSLRFQEIASSYEGGLPKADSLVADGDILTGLEVPITAFIDALRSCMAQNVFLASIADRLIRLQLQIYARFIDWVDEVAQSSRANPAVDPNNMATFYQRLVDMDAPKLLMEDASRVIPDPDVAERVKGAYMESETRLVASAEGLLDAIADSIAAKCVECLGQIRGILAALRMTSRTPTAPAQYASVILRPLHAFLEANNRISPEVKSIISKRVISQVASQFRAIARETLTTATRTEESLKKLRSRKERTEQDKEEDASASRKVSQMMAMQLRLDIAEFAKRATELVDRDELKEVDELAQDLAC